MTLTRPAPLPPGDDPLLWGAFALVVGLMLATLATGCGDAPEQDVHGAVYAPSCANGCEDLNPCTDDVCAANGCTHEPTDGVMCTTPGLPSGVCWGGACACIDVAGCDDGNPCTVDACNAGACGHEDAVCST